MGKNIKMQPEPKALVKFKVNTLPANCINFNFSLFILLYLLKYLNDNSTNQ